MNTHTLTLPYRFIVRHERMLVLALGLFSLIAIGSYIYGVIGTTIEVTHRRNLESEIRLANTRISEIEIAYFNTITAITLDHARELGFTEARDVSFAYIPSASEVALVR